MSKKSEDREAAEKRAADTRRQVAEGKKMMQIMAERQAENSRKLLEKALKNK